VGESETHSISLLFSSSIDVGVGSLHSILDPPALFLSVSAPLFVDHLNNSRISTISASVSTPLEQNSAQPQSQPQPPEGGGVVTDGELLELYHGAKELLEMFEAFCPEYVLISLSSHCTSS